MLDHAKLAKSLHALSEELFVDFSHEYHILQQVWKRIITDNTFSDQVRSIHAPWPVPTWYESLDYVYDISPYQDAYYAFSVDGSQIYPDRHRAIGCYLINIGLVIIAYDGTGMVTLSSEPHVFHGKDSFFEGITSHEMVNAQRQELELRKGVEIALCDSEKTILLLFDGSLIFWHVSSYEETVKKEVLSRYIDSIMQLYEKKILSAWYISMPKSKELITIVRLALCDFIPERKELYECIDMFVDTSIMQEHLRPSQRSIVFKNNAPISVEYPIVIAPYFFYIHAGQEIGRVEIPAWIAQDARLVDLIARMVIDQCIKGQGYPIVLAEAHEQAVVKGADRDLFYYLVDKIGLQFNRRPVISKKSFKKQRVSI